MPLESTRRIVHRSKASNAIARKAVQVTLMCVLVTGFTSGCALLAIQELLDSLGRQDETSLELSGITPGVYVGELECTATVDFNGDGSLIDTDLCGFADVVFEMTPSAALRLNGIDVIVDGVLPLMLPCVGNESEFDVESIERDKRSITITTDAARILISPMDDGSVRVRISEPFREDPPTNFEAINGICSGALSLSTSSAGNPP